MTTFDTPLVDCNVPYTYWISWSGGHLTLGRNSIVGLNPLLTYMDPSPLEINFMAVDGLCPDIEGNWTIPNSFYSGGEFFFTRLD
jgi:hypothetical protein